MRIISIFLVAPFFLCSFTIGQVGINTTNPTATLDVNGNLKIRTTPTVGSMENMQVILLNKDSYEVSQIGFQAFMDIINNGGYPSEINTTVYAAKKKSNFSLINLSLFSNGFKSIAFSPFDKTVGDDALYSTTDGSYIVPSDGTYAIGFSFKYGNGLQASILTGGPGLGIGLTRSGSTMMLDERLFSGVNLSVALSLTISEGTINSLYNLKKNDRVNFGLINSSVITADILSTSVASFYIFKVSD